MESQPQPIDLVELDVSMAEAAARLHVRFIEYGFISSLGVPVVRTLYDGMISSDSSFGFAAIANGQVLGFICCSRNMGAAYRHILKHHFFILVRLLLPRLLSPALIWRLGETFLHPFKGGGQGTARTSAELVSIVVSPQTRGAGVGRRLVELALAECSRRGIAELQVMVGNELEANKFYQRLGFRRVRQFRRHGRLASDYVIEVPPRQ